MKQKIIDTGNQMLVSRPDSDVPSSSFNLSHDVKDTFNIGQLIPVMMEECLPGDVWHIRSEALLRLVPLLAPVMHRANLRLEYFFVPNRIIWDGWEDFISPPKVGFVPPAYPTNSDGFTSALNNLMPHLDLPPGKSFSPDTLGMLPFAAYARAYYDWYYDQNFTGAAEFIDANNQFIPLKDGDSNEADQWIHIMDRNNDRDYFTSAVPWPQKGADVVIPVDGTVNFTPGIGTVEIKNSVTGALVTGSMAANGSGFLTAGGTLAALDPQGSLAVDVGTINDLRTASAVQRWLEADTFGTRYIENIKSQFDTVVEDYRLQRCEYLGMTMEPITFSEVLQTSETSTTPQGNMAGHGIAAHGKASHEHYLCREHGHLVVIASVLPVTSYGNGLPRKFSRRDRLDYPWPVLAHTGYQEVLNQEIFWQNNGSSGDQQTWGYVPRYNEFRTITNKFRTDFVTDLNYWQMSPSYTTLPPLSTGFIQNNFNDSAQIFADTEQNDNHLILHVFHQCTVERKLPKFAVPVLR